MPGIEDGSGFILLSAPQDRHYAFSDDGITHEIEINKVVKIRHAGGYEYLETEGGEQYVIAPGWTYMHATPGPWVFRP